MYTATICKHQPHVTHYQCKPVKVLEIKDNQALIAPLTVTQDFEPHWISTSYLGNLHLVQQEPCNEEIGTHVIVSGGAVLEV